MDGDKSRINHQKNYSLYLERDVILNELRCNKSEIDLALYRKMLAYPPEVFNSSWTPVLLELLNVVADKERNIDEKRLGSQAMFTIVTLSCSIDEQRSFLRKVFGLNSEKLLIFNGELRIIDVELFKLIVAHGCLVGNRNMNISSDILIASFDIIHKYCMTYSEHIYISFKSMEIWLRKSKDIDFWCDDNCGFEKKVEEIIFSNWDNCINEVSKINASQLFPLYLGIMQNKYHGFLEYALTTTVEHVSWQNPTKYVIITEIYKSTSFYPNIPNLELNIFQSLRKSHLRHVGTKLYVTLMEKMKNEDDWNNLFGEYVHANAKILESEDDAGALHVLWELWMKPTMMRFKELLIPSLWVKFCKDGTMKSASYIAKLSSEIGMTWAQLNSESQENSDGDHVAAIARYWQICENTLAPPIIDVSEDYVKLNVFAVCCRMKDFLLGRKFELCIRFLYFNANSCSSQFREGLFENFSIFFDSVVKNCSSQSQEGQYDKFTDFIPDPEKKLVDEDADHFFNCLFFFVADCLELGSCYQRRMIGLTIYEIILRHTADTPICRRVVNRFYLFILLKLCLDPIEDIRARAFNIINRYFNIAVLTTDEINTLRTEADKNSRSSKFYEIDGGVKLTHIGNSSNRSGFNSTFGKFFYDATSGLFYMKQDILNALTKGSNFNASLLALLEQHFPPSHPSLSEPVFRDLLRFVRDATDFFLSALSPKASSVTYSSSFAEMGIAIEEKIKASAVAYEHDKKVISPAHQIIISCVWMALKTLCDLAAKISTATSCCETAQASLDVIVSVLMKCRHKGAIEAAGVALGRSIRSLAQKPEHHRFIESHLDRILCLNSEDKIDLTRRGAGISIMFHTIITNDDKKTRRLLHVAVKRLMTSLRDPAIESDVGIDSNQDCVCGRQLHFLRTIVADKALYCHLVAYFEEISIICLKHLQSREWAIRNGSLQLLGALIPRLVGQSPESELDFGNGYSVNHFLTHYPILADFILERISNPTAFDINSDIMAILILISKMSVGGCDFIDHSSQGYVTNLKNALRILFGHTVDHVRYAAAKAYAALVPVCSIPQELLSMTIEKLKKKSYNFIHGHLMAQICLHLSAEHAGMWLDTFPNHKLNMTMIHESGIAQSCHFRDLVNCCGWYRQAFQICYVIEATFLQSFRMSWSVWKGHRKLDELVSFEQFFVVMRNVSVCLPVNRASGFMEQLNKFNVSADWETVINMVSREILKEPGQLGTNEDYQYHCLKYLHGYIVEMYINKDANPSVPKQMVSLVEQYFRTGRTDYRGIQMICDATIIALSHSIDLDTYENSDILPNRMESHLYPVLDTTMSTCTHPQFHYLLTKMHLLLDISVESISNFAEMKYNILQISTGDEVQRTLGIDILMLLRREYFQETDLCEGALDFLIATLSDENCEIRDALYEKMRENQWPNSIYYGPAEPSGAYPKCQQCPHSEYEHIKSLITKNLHLWLHNVISIFAYSYMWSLYSHHKWLPVLKPNTTTVDNQLESPFDQDETYREITKTVNILFHYRGEKPTHFVTPNDCEDIMKISYFFLKFYIVQRGHFFPPNYLKSLLQCTVSDYLQSKMIISANSCSHRTSVFDDIEESYPGKTYLNRKV